MALILYTKQSRLYVFLLHKTKKVVKCCQKGFKLIETTDLHELADQFEKWKEDILLYARDKDERVVLSLHLVDIPYQSAEERINTVIEIKCTRKDHSEAKLNKELGEDAFFYKCSKLIIYVYDKEHKITDTDNFIKSLERTKETAGKDIKVYVEQANKLI